MKYLELAEAISSHKLSMNDERVRQAENEIAEVLRTEQGKQELAEVIGVYIDESFPLYDMTRLFTKSKDFRFGDKPEFRLKKRGIRAYWIAPNSSTPKSRNYQETLTMEFETISVRPTCLKDDLESGRISSLSELINDARYAMQLGIIEKTMTLINQVYNETESPEQFAVSSGGLTQQAVDKAIDTVRYKTGLVPVIIGDMLLTNEIMKFDGFSNEALEDMRQMGSVGIYRGARIIALPEMKDEITQDLIVPTDRLYVVSKELGYSATYGNAKVGQETSIEDWSWNSRIDKEWGLTVTAPKGMFVIEVQ